MSKKYNISEITSLMTSKEAKLTNRHINNDSISRPTIQGSRDKTMADKKKFTPSVNNNQWLKRLAWPIN